MEISIKKEQGNLDGHVLYAITAEEIQKFSNKFNVTRTEIDCLLKDSRYVIQLKFFSS